ncbi:hypothetical protein TRVA0_031S00672 [Trichomonascus vanleenenianus]|uniref:uncharacterized protein n=1 Tax=Trichomonascus vanleenenianus TaxID=2268995 RepID=UPI003EC9B189
MPFSLTISKNRHRKMLIFQVINVIKAELWQHLLIDYRQDEVTFTSIQHKDLLYRIPLHTLQERRDGKLHLHDVVLRFETLVKRGCIEQLTWKFHSAPAIEVADSTTYLMDCVVQCRIPELQMDISEQSGRYLLTLFNAIKFFRGELRLKLRCDDFFSNGTIAREIINEMNNDKYLDWQCPIDLYVELPMITAECLGELESIDVLASLSIGRLDDEKVLDQLIMFMKNNYPEINIHSFETPGEVKIHFPRGNISFGSIARQSKVILSCDKNLGYLAVTQDI